METIRKKNWFPFWKGIFRGGRNRKAEKMRNIGSAGKSRKTVMLSISAAPGSMRIFISAGWQNIPERSSKSRMAATSSAVTVLSPIPEGGCGAAGRRMWRQKYGS